MSKLPIFEQFLSVGEYHAKTQVIFQAQTQAKMLSIELGPMPSVQRGPGRSLTRAERHLYRRPRGGVLRGGRQQEE